MRFRWLLTLLFLSIFCLESLAQAGRPQSKELLLLRDSGTVYFSVEELIPDPALRKKYLMDIEYVKRDDNGALLLKPKNSIKPKLRIEVNTGTSVVSVPEDSLLKTPTQINRFEVRDILKNEQYLVVKVIDNYNNSVLSNEKYELNPKIIHKYNPELHYTDVDGNPQIYTNDSKTWIPISPTSSAKVVVKDEYGKSRKVLSVHFIDSYSVGGPNGCNPIPVNETDTLRTWEVQALCRFQKRNGIYIQATVEGENKLKRYSELLFITKDK
ncbi:MAG: hypothetical protein IK005_10770 [Paludibacteraceae bacterium]|nr:hypothetical protein [Paludibacteraceae bacterium]